VASVAAQQQDVFVPMDAGIVTFDVGWAMGKNEATAKNANGASFQFTADWVTFRPRISIGVTVASMNLHEETDGIRNNLNTVPVYFAAKYWFGKDGGRVYGFAGGGIGGYNSTLETLEDETDDYTKNRTSGLALGVPVGVIAFVGKRLFLTANYQFNWFNKSFYQDDIAHAVFFGLGLTFGIDDDNPES
jgi:hypothetical protein